jgi:hypothetical protein
MSNDNRSRVQRFNSSRVERLNGSKVERHIGFINHLTIKR